MSWKASLAIVFLELWKTCSTPRRMLFFIHHSFHWFVFVCIICSGYLLAHRQTGQTHAGFSLWCCYKKIKTASNSKSDCFLLLVSVKLVSSTSQAEGVAAEAQSTAGLDSKMLWPWRLSSPKTKHLFDGKPEQEASSDVPKWKQRGFTSWRGNTQKYTNIER